ncbi:hypothetical protein F53441_5424 [Fusarium austroafricanum]|uniref:Uncharacterized protein n=1 Tax=Fusarium austroafricanum TaxID=2364996 RepID=A0A8H4KKU5_9HYPO|nr:hypothetical protein F53441_5424 [Fusarium austroafricanum]
MFMRNVLIAAVSLQALVEGVVAQDKVTLTKTVTRRKPKTTAGNPYEVPDVPEVTVVPTSYITDGTTIFVDETVTIPCSRCTASTAGDSDAEVTSEVITTVITSDAGAVSDQTAEVTVIPTSYITDGTTIFVDETVTIPCSRCTASQTSAEVSDSEGTSEAVSETVSEVETLSTVEATTSGDAAAEGTSEAVSESASETAPEAATTEAESLSTAEAPTDTGSITEQTADVTTVVPTSFITRGTTRYVNQTITIPCTKCAGGKKTSEVAGETTLDTSAAIETTGATQDAAETSSAPAEETQTANTDEVKPSTETPIPTTIILTTGKGQSTVSTQPGPFANTTIPAGAETTGSGALPSAVTSEAATSSAVVSKVNKPVIVVIREVTIFHRTIVIGAACPPVKRGNKGDFVVGTGSDEKSFTKIGEALTDACDKQFKDCSENAGKNFEVSDCQKQREICRSDASSTAKAPTPALKESTETASVILPPDAEVTGNTKPRVGGHVVISTRTLTVSESCAISDGTPVIEGPTKTGAGKTTETAAAETTSDAEAVGSTAKGVETSEAATETATGVVESSEAVTIVTMTKPDGEVSTTAITLTNGVPTGTDNVPGETQVDTTPAVETTAAAETTQGDETVTLTKSGVVIITMTKSDGEVSTTAITLSNGVPTGTGALTVPGEGEKTTVEAPTQTGETAIGQETTVPAGGDKTTVPAGGHTVVTKTVTNQVTSYVTVGVNTATVGVETVTVTNQLTETVTVPCGAGQTANVVTSVVTQCPVSTMLSTTRAPETVYVTATVEAARLHSDYPVPQRVRRMLGFW